MPAYKMKDGKKVEIHRTQPKLNQAQQAGADAENDRALLIDGLVAQFVKHSTDKKPSLADIKSEARFEKLDKTMLNTAWNRYQKSLKKEA